MGGFVERLTARWKGEVGAGALEAFRRAGGAVYTDYHEAELVRRRLVEEGVDPWQVDRALGAQMLCAWNAFVVQVLGENLLDADFATDPRTAGYLPAVTHEQVSRCFEAAERWSSLARQAAAGHVPAAERWPAALPAWVETDPCPASLLQGLLAASRTIREHVEVAWGLFEPAAGGDGVDRLRGLLAKATAAADYAEALLAGDSLPELRDEIEIRLHQALADYHRLGQLIAMPALLSEDVSPPPPPAAGEPSDIWRLTSPFVIEKYSKNRQKEESLRKLWRQDPDPTATLRIQSDIEAILANGRIEYATGRNGGHHPPYHRCPWGAIYRATRVVRIGDQLIEKGELFTFRPRPQNNRGFTRKLLVGTRAITNS